MTYINVEEMYQWYVDDVINRNNTAIEFKKQIKEFSEKIPQKSIEKFVEDFYNLQTVELGVPEIKTDDNDFDTFKKNIRINVIIYNFPNRPETLAVKDKIIAARESGDTKALNEIADKLYPTFGTEIAEKNLEEKVWKIKLIDKATETANRKLINEDFEADFTPKEDRGNCTKGITASLYRAAKEFGLNIYQTNQDKENAAHPKTLVAQLDKYVKKSESGLLQNIEDIHIGDIVVLPDGEGKPRHAMMVSGFDEQGKPLLLGFTPTQKNAPMYENKDGTPRTGIVIDVHAFIKDKVKEHNRAELSQIMFRQKKTQNR